MSICRGVIYYEYNYSPPIGVRLVYYEWMDGCMDDSPYTVPQSTVWPINSFHLLTVLL